MVVLDDHSSRNIIIHEWLLALRNPNNRQIQNSLTNGDGFCCLGILFTLFGAKPVHDEYSGWMLEYNGGNRKLFVTNSLWERLELPDQRVFSKMNDHYGYSFLRIAEEIESLVGWNRMTFIINGEE